MRLEKRIVRVKFGIPGTREQGSCEIVGKSWPMETAEANALRDYNRRRAHDGQPPLKRFPAGTTKTTLSN